MHYLLKNHSPILYAAVAIEKLLRQGFSVVVNTLQFDLVTIDWSKDYLNDVA